MKPLTILDCGKILVYQKGSFFRFDKERNSLEFFSKLPNGFLMSILSKFRPTERAFRLIPRCAIKISESLIFSHRGYMYSINLISGSIDVELKFRSGMQSPLYISRVYGIDGFADGLYFGEYFGNDTKNSVSLFHRDSTTTEWNEVYTFAKGSINHVHNIVPCHRENRILVCTGDDNESSVIWEFREDFKIVRKLLGGSQLFRSCFLTTTEKGLVYFTDAPNTSNYMIEVNETGQSITFKVLNELEGSVIYGVDLPDGKLFFSTTVEPNSELKGFRYLFSRIPGTGIIGSEAIGYVADVSGNMKEVIRGSKDFLPMALFKFGAFQPVVLHDRLYVYPEGLTDLDGKMLECKY